MWKSEAMSRVMVMRAKNSAADSLRMGRHVLRTAGIWSLFEGGWRCRLEDLGVYAVSKLCWQA